MGIIDLPTLRALPDIQKDTKWNIVFTRIPGALGVASNDIDLRSVTLDLPKKTIGIMEVNIREHQLRPPARHTFSQTLTLTSIETVDAKIRQFIKGWRELCSENNTQKVAPKAQREADFLIYHCDDQWMTQWSYKVSGAWITDSSPPGMKSDNPSAFQIPIIFAYHSFEENPGVG